MLSPAALGWINLWRLKGWSATFKALQRQPVPRTYQIWRHYLLPVAANWMRVLLEVPKSLIWYVTRNEFGHIVPKELCSCSVVCATSDESHFKLSDVAFRLSPPIDGLLFYIHIPLHTHAPCIWMSFSLYNDSAGFHLCQLVRPSCPTIFSR